VIWHRLIGHGIWLQKCLSIDTGGKDIRESADAKNAAKFIKFLKRM